jgi:hypothetical protein
VPVTNAALSLFDMITCVSDRHVVYVTHSEPLGNTVKRRWSEFQWLRDTLAKAYSGLFLPTLPTFNVMTGATDVEGDLVRSRIQLLTAFMNELFTIPFLLDDAMIKSFLTVDGEKEFKAYMDSMNKTNLSDYVATQGSNAWRSMLDTANLTANEGTQYFEEFKRYLDTIKTSFVALNEQTAACAKHSQLLYSEMTTTTTAFGVWADAECSTTDLPPEAKSLRPPQIKKLSDALVVCSGHWTVSANAYIKMHSAANVIIQDQLVQVLLFLETF